MILTPLISLNRSAGKISKPDLNLTRWFWFKTFLVVVQAPAFAVRFLHAAIITFII